MKHIKLFILLITCVLSLNGCQNKLGKLLTVYKIDIQQGNAIEAEAVNKIILGMSKEQVRFVLGNPLIVDSFHPDRWDYIYHFTPGYGEQQRKQLSLIFDRGEIIEIIKHDIPASDTTIAEAEGSKDIDNQLESELEATKEEAQNLEEQEELENQADELEEILETNKDPI